MAPTSLRGAPEGKGTGGGACDRDGRSLPPGDVCPTDGEGKGRAGGWPGPQGDVLGTAPLQAGVMAGWRGRGGRPGGVC